MDKKQAILKSVLKLVNREGFYHLNMKNIANEAGIAAGTIYLYFKGKEDLINALYGMIVREFNQNVLSGYDEEKSVKENFFDMLDRAINFYLVQPDNFSFIEQYTYAPFLFKENQDENFLLLLPIYKLMRVGKKQNVIRNIPDSILLALIHGPMNTIIKLHLAHKTDLRKKGAKQKFFEAAWQAIAC
jgi:TetR/AcrR family transcriptional repressor of multidrug resistance operon